MFRIGSRLVAMILATVLCQPLAMAQTTAKDLSKKTADAVDTMKSYTVEKKNEAVDYGRSLMKDADRDIKRLERAAAKGSDDTKAQYKQEVKKLKASRKTAAQKLDRMGQASGDAWDGAKNAFADSYKDLRDGFDKALKRSK
ncbi:MAG TPA: hypothetical protein VGI92_07310 [Gemmatimonadales bacterium]